MSALGRLAAALRRLPVALVFVLAAYTFSALVPGWAALALQIAAVLVPLTLWERSSARLPAVVLAALGVMALWLVLAFNPNVPGLGVGLLGARKTALALAGLIAGLAVADKRARDLEALVVALLVAALGSSIAIHVLAPSLEASVQRGAGIATGELNGVPRLQGVFPGPFHVAIAACFLVGWALVRFRARPWLCSAVGALGVVALYMAEVRTGYYAIAAIVVYLVVRAPSLPARIRQLFGIVSVIGLVALTVVVGFGPTQSAYNSLSRGTSDPRFQNRLPQYSAGIHEVARSPLYGWGAGAAGDTLGDRFPPGHVHVSAHNFVLKIAVEGGAIGLAAWAWLAWLVARARWRQHDPDKVAGVAIAVMVVFGISGSMIEALPVTYLLLALVGVTLARARTGIGQRRQMVATAPGSTARVVDGAVSETARSAPVERSATTVAVHLRPETERSGSGVSGFGDVAPEEGAAPRHRSRRNATWRRVELDELDWPPHTNGSRRPPDPPDLPWI